MRFKMTPDLRKKMIEYVKISEANRRDSLVRGSDRGLLLRSISYLKNHGFLDDEDIERFPKRYPLTSQEFSDLCSHLTADHNPKHIRFNEKKCIDLDIISTELS